MRAFITLAIIATTLPIRADEGSWRTPVLGAIFDTDSRSIRPVIGTIGAATLGDPVASPVKTDNAFIAPDGSSAIVTGAEGTALLVWNGDSVRFSHLSEAVRPVSVTWSGARFAMYDGGSIVQVWDSGALVETRSVEPAAQISLCRDGRLVSGVCAPDADYVLENSTLVRIRGEVRETADLGPFTTLAAEHGLVVAAGRELVVLGGSDTVRIPLRSPALSVTAVRTPGAFAIALEDGSRWLIANGEMQLLEGGRQ